MSWRAFGETFVTLAVITDPLGNAPVFLAITRKLTPGERRRAALRACLFAGTLILGFAIFGEIVLRYLRVSIGSLSIAGGLLLLIVALEMLRGTDFPTGESEDIALVPLATPRRRPGCDRNGNGAVAEVPACRRSRLGHPRDPRRVACVGLTLIVAERLTRAVGPSIFSFLTRVFGLLLSAIAVQLVVNGIRSLT